MIKKILVATDASSASNRAVAEAAYMASVHEAELLILHVIRDMQLPAQMKSVPELEAHTAPGVRLWPLADLQNPMNLRC